MEKVPAPIGENELSKLEGEYTESLTTEAYIIREFEGDEYKSLLSVGEKERQSFLRKLALGEIKKEDVLKKIAHKKESLDHALIREIEAKDALQHNAGYRILLNLVISRGVSHSVSVPKVMDILETYPEPADFENLLNQTAILLEPIERRNLEKHGRKLMRLLYGEKEKIWEELKLMELEGKFIYKNEVEKDKGYGIYMLNPQEIRGLKSRIEIHGDEWQGRKLNADYLYAQGLEPHFQIEMNGQIMWLSSLPYAFDERIAVVGYFEQNNKLVARSFYRSNSHGVWKYIPSYLGKEHIAWFGKGFGEQSVSLPIPLQRILAEVSSQEVSALIVDDPEFIFAGTARNVLKPHSEEITYQAEVQEVPTRLKGAFYPKKGGRNSLSEPENMVFEDESEKPDFTKPGSSWIQETSEYGAIRMETFPSKNGKLEYMFCVDKLNRAWLGAVDGSSRIGSTGLRQKWIDAGDLTTPAFTYTSEDGGYGNYDLQRRNYVDMYKNYLSRIPVIQEFQKHKQASKA